MVAKLSVTKCDRVLLALAQFGVFGCIASFIISSPILYTTYLGGQPGAIGLVGVVMGFWNAFNGVPIAAAADTGLLNRKIPRCFAAEKWGRRAPWILVGVPLTALSGLLMWLPPTYGQGPAAIAVWYGVVYFLLATGFTAALQSIMAAVQELMPDAKSLSQQVALGQPVNLIAYTMAGLVIPSIAFTEAPDGATVGTSCCIQPLQRCVGSDKMSTCSCYENSTHFHASVVEQCPVLAGSTASIGYVASRCVRSNRSTTTAAGLGGGGASLSSSQFMNFAICGVLLFFMTMVSWLAVPPARKTQIGKDSAVMLSSDGQRVNICNSLRASFGLHSFRWTAFANLFANVNEQATVQLLPFYIIYWVGVDFRDVGNVNALVAGGQLGAALLSVPLFAYMLSLEKDVSVTMKKKKDRSMTKKKTSTSRGGGETTGEELETEVETEVEMEADGVVDGVVDGATEVEKEEEEEIIVVKVPTIHPIYFMSIAAAVKLVIQLPLTIMAAVNHNVLLLAAAGFAGGTSTGGQPQVTQVLMGWVMDDDEMRHDGVRREGMILSSNALVQHCSFIMISAIIGVWGALGLDTSKCPMDQPLAATNAVFYTYTWLNASWLLIYSVTLLFYPIKGDALSKVVATTELRRRRREKKENEVVSKVVE